MFLQVVAVSRDRSRGDELGGVMWPLSDVDNCGRGDRGGQRLWGSTVDEDGAGVKDRPRSPGEAAGSVVVRGCAAGGVARVALRIAEHVYAAAGGVLGGVVALDVAGPAAEVDV